LVKLCAYFLDLRRLLFQLCRFLVKHVRAKRESGFGLRPGGRCRRNAEDEHESRSRSPRHGRILSKRRSILRRQLDC